MAQREALGESLIPTKRGPPQRTLPEAIWLSLEAQEPPLTYAGALGHINAHLLQTQQPTVSLGWYQKAVIRRREAKRAAAEHAVKHPLPDDGPVGAGTSANVSKLARLGEQHDRRMANAGTFCVRRLFHYSTMRRVRT